MKVCKKCKTENEDWKLRCGSCGQVLSQRGDFGNKAEGPTVVVHGSVEDYKRGIASGDIEVEKEDAFNWLDESAKGKLAPDAPKAPTRKVSVKDVDKISGLKDISKYLDILKEDAETAEAVSKLSAAPPSSSHPDAPPLGTSYVEAQSPPAPPPPPPAAASPPPARPPSGRVKTSTGRTVRPGAPALDDRTPVQSVPVPKPPVAHEPTASDYADGAEVFALACDLFREPFVIEPGKKSLIGRDSAAQIRLEGASVSRRHAQLSFDEKGDCQIEDLRSRNGTYVNGCAVQRRRLNDGDRIDVGSYSFEFQRGAARPVAADAGAETRVMRAVPGTLSGDIESNGLVPIIALLHATRRSGVLTLRAARQVGRIFFNEGEVVHAMLGKATAEAAVDTLLAAEAGTFHFNDERIKIARTVTRPTAELIAKAMTRGQGS
jgi:hypothetical protein